MLFDFICGGGNMKKTLIMLGTLFVMFLMISTVTAVPKTQSTPLMDTIQSKEVTELKMKAHAVNDLDPQPTGFFDKLIEFIKLLIELIMNLVTIIQGILSIIALIQAVLSAIQLVIQLIQQILDVIFDPSNNAITA